MKGFLIPLILFAGCICAAAQTPFYCTQAGTTLEYVRTKADDGKVVWNHRLSVLENKAGQVRCNSLFTKDNGKQIASVDYTAKIDADGAVTTDLNATLMSAIKNFLPKADIKADYSPTTLPGTLTPGATLPDAASVITVLGRPFRTTVTERKVLRTETLKTPAGTFPCTVVTEHKIEKFFLYNRDTISYTWYSAGIGMVRHDTWKNGRCETSEVLVSF